MPPEVDISWAEKEYIEKAPVFCSVDLRDGNQALVAPMTVRQKLDCFRMLTEIGFKQIEVGFPASSETEYQFVRKLIEEELIPEDVTIQVLTQPKKEIIESTFKALEGVKKATVHLYHPTSPFHRERVLGETKQEVLSVIRAGARLIRKKAEKMHGEITPEFSPEYFTGTEMDYVLEVCNAVLDEWDGMPSGRMIINLPGTVELSMPHVFADQVRYISSNLKYRDKVLLSLHPHNDRGCAVADAELGLLAGAQRLEGTLFGNGERAGNCDLITVALNLYAQGTDPGLSLGRLDEIRERYEMYTGIKVHQRSPYSGALVFAAFSGTHQDAISKSIRYREKNGEEKWNVPYLPIDPADVNGSYDTEVIRINSQSGKGGVGFILEQHFGLKLPEKMREEMRTVVKEESENRHKELHPDEVLSIFKQRFENIYDPYRIDSVHFRQHNGIVAEVETVAEGSMRMVLAGGNGRLNAVSNALKKVYPVQYDLIVYEEHALEQSSGSRAIAYVGIRSRKDQALFWGAGVDVDIIRASIDALLAAVNNLARAENAAMHV